MSTHSALYEGWVRHRRGVKVPHAFVFNLYMMYLDLSELPGLFRGVPCWSARRRAVSWFRRADYLGDPALPLDEAVRRKVAEVTGRRPEGPVRMLTQLRTFGVEFNPITLYFCFALNGGRLEAVVAEVTNTPWGERHAYVLPVPGDAAPGRINLAFDKILHVSPFMESDYRYVLRGTVPVMNPDSPLVVHLENRRDGKTHFDATLSLRRRELSPRTLLGVLLRKPFMPARTLAAIYWYALRLWWKGVPYVPHPGSGGQPHSAGDSGADEYSHCATSLREVSQ
jgi:DUF1365 family protein